MNNTISAVAAAVMIALTSFSYAGQSKTYQVTGPILEVTDTMIAVQKGKERWELARNASTRASGELKVGEKVTITYSMTATNVEVKGAAKEDASVPRTTPSSPSPAKR